MTRPIFEPTPARTDRKLGFSSDQLFRRPAPASGASSCVLGRPDFIIYSGGTTAPTDTWMPIPFEDLAYPPTTVLGDVFSASITDVGDPGNDRWEVETHVKGWYAYELRTEWDQVASGGSVEFAAATQRVTWSSTSGMVFGETDIRESADWMDVDVHGDFEMFDNPWLHGFNVVFVPNGRTWRPTAIQRTGVDRGLSGIAMKFWFICEDTLGDWTFDSV